MDDLNRTLQEIDGEDWGEAPYLSHLVTECHRLRSVPLNAFRVEDLRCMIGQQFNLDVLVPLAIDRLKENPWIDGNLYEGDLLDAVVNVRPSFWQANPLLFQRFREIACRALAIVENGRLSVVSCDGEVLIRKLARICDSPTDAAGPSSGGG